MNICVEIFDVIFFSAFTSGKGAKGLRPASTYVLQHPRQSAAGTQVQTSCSVAIAAAGGMEQGRRQGGGQAWPHGL